MSTRGIIRTVILISFVILFFALSTKLAHADFIDDPIGTISGSFSGMPTDPGSILTKAINLILTFAEVAFVILFLIGGVMYLTGMGNEEQVGKARKMIIEAIIGIFIVFAAWAASTWILKSFKGGGGINPTSAASSVLNAASAKPPK